MQEEFEKYMHQCLELAKTAMAAGNPPVGALIVFEQKVLGTGIESGKSTGDITNHAEILAIKDTIKNGYSDQLPLARMYTTHEPCIMCSYVIRHYKIPEIVYGVSVPLVGGLTSQFTILSTEQVPKWGIKPNIIGGVCQEECNELTRQFMLTQTPNPL
ncbi:nucleoside deaminase [Xanthocytophaga agilis]|uniref:Nucleoside deaminase n=1 Tax=Xanthocytophaga agilis TaxID=3048010 RepID=A0AAE3UHE4_9BACT|nr:nucleoside deaminase [Xanthocytophaga agilis]MDJ1505365.1 nucleoside deaminase [Xanthocytophaga agilis]